MLSRNALASRVLAGSHAFANVFQRFLPISRLVLTCGVSEWLFQRAVGLGARMTRVADKQPIVFKVRLPTHADQDTWDRFVARAQADGVTLGDLFRSLIYGYA